MAYVVTSPCFGCKYTDCVTVCPADCFHEGDQMLYINPDDCVDCDACRSECPVEAIFPEWEVPAEWQDFIQLNAEMSAKCPPITESRWRQSDECDGPVIQCHYAKNEAEDSTRCADCGT